MQRCSGARCACPARGASERASERAPRRQHLKAAAAFFTRDQLTRGETKGYAHRRLHANSMRSSCCEDNPRPGTLARRVPHPLAPSCSTSARPISHCTPLLSLPYPAQHHHHHHHTQNHLNNNTRRAAAASTSTASRATPSSRRPPARCTPTTPTASVATRLRRCTSRSSRRSSGSR